MARSSEIRRGGRCGRIPSSLNRSRRTHDTGLDFLHKAGALMATGQSGRCPSQETVEGGHGRLGAGSAAPRAVDVPVAHVPMRGTEAVPREPIMRPAVPPDRCSSSVSAVRSGLMLAGWTGGSGALSGVDSASGRPPRGPGDGFWPSETSAGRRKRAQIGSGDAKRSLQNQRINHFLLAGAKFALTGPLVLYLFGPCRGAHSASPPSTGIALSITVVVPDRATRKVTCCPEKAGLTDRLMFRRRIAL